MYTLISFFITIIWMTATFGKDKEDVLIKIDSVIITVYFEATYIFFLQFQIILCFCKLIHVSILILITIFKLQNLSSPRL